MYIFISLQKEAVSKSIFKNVCNEKLFAQLHSQWAQELVIFLYYKFGHQIQPEDKAQEAFIKLWKHCKKTPPEKVKSFLFTVANNLALNDIKHQKVVLKHQKQAQKEKSTTLETPHFTLEKKEYEKKFEHALSQLTEAQRVAFMMNRAEGKKHKEIAEILGISRKAVEKRIYTAVDKLREYLDEI